MSAIWGVAAPNIDQSLKAAFNKMVELMPFSNKDKTNMIITDKIAIGHSTVGTIHEKGYPIFCDDGKIITICGLPIWEGDDCLVEMNSNVDDDNLLDANLIRYALNNNKLDRLGGVYAFAEWDPKLKVLLLGTDRLGFRNFYYYHDSSRNIIYFASRLRGIADNPLIKKDINFKTILEFLHFGHPLGDKTFYKQISVLSPGSLLRYGSFGSKKTQYWNIGDIPIDHNMSYEDAIDSNIEAFKNAIHRRVNRCKRNKTIVLLSGGADSRRIAGELHCQGVEFETYTTKAFTAENSDGSIAANISKILKKRNTFIDFKINGFIEKYWSQSNSLNDYECCLHQWLLPLAEKIPEKRCFNYDGIAGDILNEGVFRASGFAESEIFFRLNSANIHDKTKKILGKEPNLSFLKEELRKKIKKETLYESIYNSLKLYEESENQLTLFYLMNRTRRAINLASGRILQGKFETISPFLDYNFLISSLSVPYKYRLPHTLRKHIVEKAYPEISRIPYSQYKLQVSGYSNEERKAYQKEKARQLRRNIWKYFILDNRVLEPRQLRVKLLTQLGLTFLGHYIPPYEFGLTFQLFYEWIEKKDIHFSDIEKGFY